MEKIQKITDEVVKAIKTYGVGNVDYSTIVCLDTKNLSVYVLDDGQLYSYKGFKVRFAFSFIHNYFDDEEDEDSSGVDVDLVKRWVESVLNQLN